MYPQFVLVLHSALKTRVRNNGQVPSSLLRSVRSRRIRHRLGCRNAPLAGLSAGKGTLEGWARVRLRVSKSPGIRPRTEHCASGTEQTHERSICFTNTGIILGREKEAETCWVPWRGGKLADVFTWVILHCIFPGSLLPDHGCPSSGPWRLRPWHNYVLCVKRAHTCWSWEREMRSTEGTSLWLPAGRGGWRR